VEVSGTLTYKGKPVPYALINFTPEEGRSSVAETDAEGRFTIRYTMDKAGVQVGKHKVSVSPRQNVPGTQASIEGKAAPPKELEEFYAKYGQKSTKEIVIEKSTSDLKLDLD